MPEIKKISQRNVNGLRRWRDRQRKIVHAFDPHQHNNHNNPVRTLCGATVLVTSEGPYATLQRDILRYMPAPERRTPDLPSLTTRLTCLMCMAASWRRHDGARRLDGAPRSRCCVGS